MNETVSTIPGVTTDDLAWWRNKIATLDWVFAVRYAEGAPHEYVSDCSEGLSESDLTRAARVIHTFGEPQKFYKWTRIYLVIDGWKYWTMDKDHADVRLVNRGRADHVYGVQNAPRTLSHTTTAYDEVATWWDSQLAASEVERQGYQALVDEVTRGRRTCRTLDIGAGTGLALDLELTGAPRLTAIDPSQSMLNELVRKHPHVARVEPDQFSRVVERKALAGTRFELVLALGGAASYLTAADWEALPNHARGNLVLSVYADGQQPFTTDLDAESLSCARQHARDFATQHDGRVERVGRYDVVVASAGVRTAV